MLLYGIVSLLAYIKLFGVNIINFYSPGRQQTKNKEEQTQAANYKIRRTHCRMRAYTHDNIACF